MSDDSCNPHLELVSFKFPLEHFAESLRQGRRTKVIAIGSSSTAGEPTAPDWQVKIVPYPARLELKLRKRYPGRMIDVMNRGVSGQQAPEELIALRERRHRRRACSDHLAGWNKRHLSPRLLQSGRRCSRDHDGARLAEPPVKGRDRDGPAIHADHGPG
jgi:hypothetical protein